jgi:hypothetical protein
MGGGLSKLGAADAKASSARKRLKFRCVGAGEQAQDGAKRRVLVAE